MKVAPLHRVFEQSEQLESKIIHTGQHYDERMSDIFFRQLEMPEPHVYLGIGSGTHAQQTARIMTAFEAVVLDEQPDLVLVVGDVNLPDGKCGCGRNRLRGIKEETTFLNVPCLTLRENTERPVTIRLGTNELMPLEPDRIALRVADLLEAEQGGKSRRRYHACCI